MSSPAEDKHLPADRLTAVTKGAGRGHSESERGKALWSPALPDACPRAQSLLNIPLPLGIMTIYSPLILLSRSGTLNTIDNPRTPKVILPSGTSVLNLITNYLLSSST